MINKTINTIKNIMKKTVPSHEQANSIREIQIYPTHSERTASVMYQKNHDKLIHESKISCFFCDKSLEECKEVGLNLETHHWFEYSLWEALDTIKMLNDLEKLDFYGFAKEMKGTELSSPDDIRNLVVLCSSCHRESGYGIHHATIPFVWARRVLKDKNSDVLKKIKPLANNDDK